VSNKISGFDTRTGPVGAGRAVESARDPSTDARPQSQSDSAVHITGSARQLADLEQVVKDMPAIDEARVAAFRDALAAGSYRIMPERIADHLLHLEQALAPLGESEK
jgi:negative regulator of flagellin synthesis FlgM